MKVDRLNKKLSTHNFKNRANDNRETYNSKRWNHIRLIGLQQQPFCVECLKENKPFHECIGNTRDHITPINEGGAVWELSNHQTLCSRHHNIKSARESRKGGAG